MKLLTTLTMLKLRDGLKVISAIDSEAKVSEKRDVYTGT